MSASNRIQWLHKYIVEMRYPNASRLAERFNISHRQAQRDVDCLRNDLGAPLAYSAEHRGFYYTKDFSLPSYTVSANEYDYVEAVTGNVTHHKVNQEILQMQIPYSAVLRIPDKLTRMELQEFIVGEESRDHYMCEFHSVDMFLGLLLASEADIAIVKPAWLRERLVNAARRVLRNNDFQESEE
jgi:predicted DNA-binding transcriptional regulator YafY